MPEIFTTPEQALTSLRNSNLNDMESQALNFIVYFLKENDLIDQDYEDISMTESEKIYWDAFSDNLMKKIV